MVDRTTTPTIATPVRPRALLLAALAIALACRASPPSREPDVAEASPPPASTGLRIVGRVIQADAPLAGVRVSVFGAPEPVVVSGDDGGFELVPNDEFARAPAIHVQLEVPDGPRLGAALRNAGGRIDATFALGEPLVVELREPTPEEQAWVDVSAWAARESAEWGRADARDTAARLAHWDRIAAAIAAERDAYRRGLMIAAQFRVGRSAPETGLDRREVANAALAELALDDPRWSIHPMALASAAFESGRWAELAPRLDALITEHPQPEVAAYLALERYTQTSADGRPDEAAAIWQRWLARPALARTAFAPVMMAQAPSRVLAPGQPLPELCVEALDGGRLCTADLRGNLAVIELWSTWCQGCRTTARTLHAAHAALAGDDAPTFVSIDVYDDADTLRSFLATEPMPWRHAWVVESEREAVQARLQLESIPTLVLVDAGGTIIASSPELRAEDLVDAIRAARGR